MGGRVTICGKFERAAGHRRYIFPQFPPSSPHPPTLEKQEQTSNKLEKNLKITTKLC